LLLQAFKKYLSVNDPNQWNSIKTQTIFGNKNIAQIIKQAITETAKKLQRKEEYEINPYKSVEFGAGLIQVKECLDYLLTLLSRSPPFISSLSSPLQEPDVSYIQNRDIQPVWNILGQFVQRAGSGQISQRDLQTAKMAIQQIQSGQLDPNQVPAMNWFTDATGWVNNAVNTVGNFVKNNPLVGQVATSLLNALSERQVPQMQQSYY
jgi:hypothetical protein